MKIYNAMTKKRFFCFFSFIWKHKDTLTIFTQNLATNYLLLFFRKIASAKLIWIYPLIILVTITNGYYARAATIVVNNIFDTFDGVCSDNYGCSLRDAIANANNGDRITFSEDFLGEVAIVLLLGEIVIDKNLTIHGDIDDDPYADVRISGNDDSRIFSIPSGILATLEGLEITDGKTEGPNNGAGVYISDGNIVLIQRCIFSSNNAYASGGAIYNGNGILIVQNGLFSNNSSSNGAGIYNNGGTLTIDSGRFESNIAKDGGGAIHNNLGLLNVIHASIVVNKARYGGAIVSNNEMTINDCWIIENDATSDGGAIYCSGITSILNSSIAFNDAMNNGGGIYGSGQITIENSTFFQNTAFAYGGGVRIGASSNLNIRNVTFYYNSAGGAGGGLYIGYETGSGGEHIYNTIIASSSGGDCYINNGSLETNANNLIEDDSCSPDLSGDPMLGNYKDNGGYGWSVGLKCNSPAIDAGDNTHVPVSMTNDQRGEGFPRILDGDGNGIAIVDIGAYELNYTNDCPKFSDDFPWELFIPAFVNK